MMGTDKLVCQAAALLVLFALTLTPAKANFGWRRRWPGYDDADGADA